MASIRCERQSNFRLPRHGPRQMAPQWSPLLRCRLAWLLAGPVLEAPLGEVIKVYCFAGGSRGGAEAGARRRA